MAPNEPRIVIRGGKPLTGTVAVSGSKNAALAILAGSALAADGITVLHGLPRIADIQNMAEVMRAFGIRVDFSDGGHTARIDATRLTTHEAPAELATRYRASFWMLGPIVARMKRATIAQPGGCNIGARPIDLHLKGLSALGAEFSLSHGSVHAETPNGLNGASVYLDFPSVGATMNIMMAASLSPGVTVIENAAQEPDIEDLGNFLARMGAQIHGQGTGVLTVEGVKSLQGITYRVSPDRMEAGTFGVFAGITCGNVLLRGADIAAMRPITLKMIEAGMRIEEGPDGIRCHGAVERLRATNLAAMPHPGFPTDMQQPFTALLSIADGTSIVTDHVYENRFRHLTELAKMGVQSQVNGRTAVITGTRVLSGADVEASDLRAGAALVAAALAAEGETRIYKTEHLERGYENLVAKLQTLGADIWEEDARGRRVPGKEKEIACSHA